MAPVGVAVGTGAGVEVGFGILTLLEPAVVITETSAVDPSPPPPQAVNIIAAAIAPARLIVKGSGISPLELGKKLTLQPTATLLKTSGVVE
jgi:hypothetical protein